MMTKLQKQIAKKFKIEDSIIFDKSYPVICPYHDDHNPSAYIYFNKNGSGWFACSGCHESKSLNQVRKDFNIKYEVSEDSNGLHNGNSHNGIADSSGSLLSNREVTRVTLELDPLVLAMEKFCEDKGITIETLKEHKAWVSKDGYLCFDYLDASGKQRTVGRLLLDDETKPRYINESGKGKGLLGYDTAKFYDVIILSESVTCWLSLRQLNYNNTVCSFGAKLSKEQAYLLRNKTVFIIFDKDFAGYEGSKKAAERLREYQGVPIILELPEFNDTNSGKNDKSKADINFLCTTNMARFKEWLDNSINRYHISSQKYYRESYFGKEKMKYYASPLSQIKFAVGLHNIVGDTGIGKSSLCIGLIESFVNQEGNVLYMNGELPHDQILARLQSRRSRFSWSEIEANPDIVEPEVRDWTDGLLERVNITGLLSLDELVFASKKYNVVMIDYLHKMITGEDDERKAINKYMTAFTELVNNYDKTILCVHRGNQNDSLTFSGSAQIKYSGQQNLILKHSDYNGTISITVNKNTRGEPITQLCKIDYAHQRITEARIGSNRKNLYE